MASLPSQEGGHRDPSAAPLRKLTVDLIKTYRHINEVSLCRLRGNKGYGYLETLFTDSSSPGTSAYFFLLIHPGPW